MIVTTSYSDSMVVVMMCMQRSLDYALQSGYCGNDADEHEHEHDHGPYPPRTGLSGGVRYLGF